MGAIKEHSVQVQILGPESCDPEVAALMEELSRLQTLVTMEMHRGPDWRRAFDIVQRTRCLIVERLYRSPRP